MQDKLLTWRKRVKKAKNSGKNGGMVFITKLFRKNDKHKHKNNNRRMGDSSSREVDASSRLDALLHERYNVANDIADAMEYLHHRRMINRDLKVDNLGFDVRSDVKLFDFGLSRWLPTSKLISNDATSQSTTHSNMLLDETFRMSQVGTRLYMAPEVAAKEPYSAKADVFSFGVVLWEILALSDPVWNRPARHDIFNGGTIDWNASEAMPLCPCWPEPLQQMLKKCVSVKPTERPSFTEIRQIFRRDLGVCEKELDGQLLEEMKQSGEFSIQDQIDADADADGAANDDSDEEEEDDHSDDEKEEGEDELGAIADFDVARTARGRRRSTHVLNFTDLSWLSSSNSLRMSDSSSNPMAPGSSRSFR